MAGMDPKIMTAVFASIAALAVGTGGSGSIDNFQNLNPQDLVGQFSTSPSDIISQFSEKPEPENPVRTVIEIESASSSISIRSGGLLVQDFENLESSSREISSDESLKFLEFSGKTVLSTGNDTLISGKSNGFSSSGVSFRKSMKLNFRTDSEKISAENVSKTAVKMEDVNIRMESLEDSTVIQKENTKLKINSFSGDITLFSENMTVILDGEVDTLNAGGTSFEG